MPQRPGTNSQCLSLIGNVWQEQLVGSAFVLILRVLMAVRPFTSEEIEARCQGASIMELSSLPFIIRITV